MAPTSLAELVAGAIIVVAVLGDVLKTILIPGPVAGRFRVIRIVSDLSLPLGRLAARNRRDGTVRLSNLVASLTLVSTFAIWLLLLLIGYGLLIDGCAAMFSPRLGSFGDALWIAGSSLMTLGLSDFAADGPARWLVVGAAVSGFSALTASITFMLQVQSGFHQREPEVLSLAGLAGFPPSGLDLLLTFAELDARDQLGPFFLRWRDWSSATLHTHLSYPILIYYRSIEPESDWVTALEAVLDASALIMAATDDPSRGAATLLHRGGTRTAGKLGTLLGLTGGDPQRVADANAAIAALRRAGYGGGDEGVAADAFAGLRADYAADVGALARHLGAKRASLASKPDAHVQPPAGDGTGGRS